MCYHKRVRIRKKKSYTHRITLPIMEHMCYGVLEKQGGETRWC